MADPITWNQHIKGMLAIGVVPDMAAKGWPLDNYKLVESNYDTLLASMASDSMPPGVSAADIAFIKGWIDHEAPPDDYPGVQRILDRAIGGKAFIGAHGTFWRGLSRDQFVAFEVPARGSHLQLLELKNGAGSNLVKALKGEAPFDGTVFSRMPIGFWWTAAQRKENLELFAQWKSDGLLEAAPPVPAMTAFNDVVTILDAAVGGPSAPVRVHGPFWRGVSRDDFVTKSVIGTPLLIVNDGASSNLIKALKGQAPFDGSSFSRMPAGRDPVPDGDIKTIQDWIDDGCPA